MSIHDSAFPYVNKLAPSEDENGNMHGLSKLEYGMLRLFPLICTWYPHDTVLEQLAACKVLVEAILDEANR